MNISKAIEIKERTGDEFLNTDPDEIDEAEELSIEALKAIEVYRSANESWLSLPLPGETKE